VRRTLDELPASLDETYERILKEIKKPNREYARRLLQCLVVAMRPLRVKELAEILAVDFDCGEGIPKLKPDWRWEHHEQALQSSCSSLITFVDVDKDVGGNGNGSSNDGDNISDLGDNINSDINSDIDSSFSSDKDNTYHDSRVVQFSHFSVKEFLTSPRLASSSGDISRYHIDLEPAHTILAEACLGVLLQLDDRVDKKDIQSNSPLAQYAAQYWVAHAQFKNVSTQVHRAMEYLFDPDRPHFAMWLYLYDIDLRNPPESPFHLFSPFHKSGATPLYYAALCGFHDIVKHIIGKYPQHVHAHGGYYLRPLMAALVGRHFQTADLLHHNGADPNVQGNQKQTPLHSAAYFGNLGIVQKLIEYGADIDARDEGGYTPLYLSSEGVNLKDPSVVRLLLDHGADVNPRTNHRSTPLHMASRWGAIEVARILLEYGADVEAEDDKGRTPLTVGKNRGDVIKLLLEHGAVSLHCST
jgi:ankyrin repeat protein